MIGGVVTDIGRDIGTILSSSAGAVLLVACVVATAVTWLLRRYGWWRGTPVVVLWCGVISLMTIAAVTLFREGLPRGFRLSALTSWSTDTLSTVLTNPLASSQVILNFLLFIPAGMAWTLITGRWQRTAIAVVVLAVAIEAVQGLIGAGSNDVADVVLNATGGLVGVFAGWAWLARRGDAAWPRRRVLAAAVAAVAAVAFGAVLAARVHQRGIGEELSEEFHGTTLADVSAWETAGTISDNVYDAISVRTDGQRFADGIREQRYPASLFGLRRCAFVVWTDDTVEVRLDSGSVCTRFIDSDVLVDGRWQSR